jgi:peptide-methionine (S)-S-oxide reductase
MRKLFFLMFCVYVIPVAARAEGNSSGPSAKVDYMSALFASGSFWTLEEAFRGIEGIHNIAVGYSGGTAIHPNYVDVSRGGTGHRETVQITYDPTKVSYGRLLNIYWRNIDPFDANGQFCDKGEIYRSAIFVRGDNQKKEAEDSKAEFEKRFGKKTAVEVLPASIFYLAEEYHQDYAQEHEFQYDLYHDTCGQEKGLQQIWGQEAGGGAYRKVQ